jgi:hypothetical protein
MSVAFIFLLLSKLDKHILFILHYSCRRRYEQAGGDFPAECPGLTHPQVCGSGSSHVRLSASCVLPATIASHPAARICRRTAGVCSAEFREKDTAPALKPQFLDLNIQFGT